MKIFADEIVSPRLRGDFIRLRPALLHVENGRVLSLESPSLKSSISRSKSVIRARLVTPGFVDSHTHLVFAGNRADEWNERLKGVSYQEIAKRGGGIKKTVAHTRATDSSVLTELALERLRRHQSYGVTTVEVKSGYGLSALSELKILKITKSLKKKSPLSILSTFMGAHAVPKEYSSEESYVDDLITRILPAVKGLADFQDVFCEKGYFSVRESVRLLNAGKKFGLIPKVHAHEFGRTGGVDVACRVGAVSADHLMDVNDLDLQSMKKSKVVPVVLPGTSFFLGGKVFAPAKKMLKAGLPVAIASDFNPGTNPTQNFPLCGTFAAVHQGLSLEEVMRGQTLNGALALNLRDRGSLEKGMRADFNLWDLETFEEIYYRYGDSRVICSYIGGRKVQ